ncbi:MAG: proline--tRNA ligase [Chloroflexota bacterium]|nr:MAG: proline--tRNA ligase [Chloroflexota bacterium]
MRMSRLFSQTLRDAPAEAEVASHRLLLRAGFIRQLAAGVFSYLPLAQRALARIEAIIREEMDAIGGQEIRMPIVHPADIWKETGRWHEIDAEMGRFNDRAGRDMVLAMTHEEVVGDLARREVQSYRQLPLLVYQIQTKWRDDPRPRAGLIRGREFTMKDSYSLDADWDGLDRQYRAHYQAYFNIFQRCGLPVIAVKSDTGMMGGRLAHEYIFLTPIGEDTLILCDACGYSANRQIATCRKPVPPPAPPAPLEKIATPDTTTIEALARLLGIAAAQTAKAVFMVATVADDAPEAGALERFVFAVVRGDMELNETKLANAVRAQRLRPATEAEIRAVGAVPGYGSPVGVQGCLIVVDDLIPNAPNLVAGANVDGYHLKNVNYGRDYSAHIVADIAAAGAGDACPACGAPLRAVRGVEVGNIFQLGTRYSGALGAAFVDRDGQQQPVIMGSYGIGVTRALACIAEGHHDEHGLRWPVTVAPYDAHLVALPGDDVARAADALYAELWAQGIATLYDDRDERAGVKFNDADLIGLPLRVTVSARALAQGAVELKRRDSDARDLVPLAQAPARIQAELDAMRAALRAAVCPVPYRG